MKKYLFLAALHWTAFGLMVAGRTWPNVWVYGTFVAINLVSALLWTWAIWDHIRQKRARV